MAHYPVLAPGPLGDLPFDYYLHDLDPYAYDRVRGLALQHSYGSCWMIRRRFGFTHHQAEDCLRWLEQEGVVGPPYPGGTREVLRHG